MTKTLDERRPAAMDDGGLKQGNQKRIKGPIEEFSILCPECGEDFFQMALNSLTIQHCPKCGWPK